MHCDCSGCQSQLETVAAVGTSPSSCVCSLLLPPWSLLTREQVEEEETIPFPISLPLLPANKPREAPELLLHCSSWTTGSSCPMCLVQPGTAGGGRGLSSQCLLLGRAWQGQVGEKVRWGEGAERKEELALHCKHHIQPLPAAIPMPIKSQEMRGAPLGLPHKAGGKLHTCSLPALLPAPSLPVRLPLLFLLQCWGQI